MNQAHWHIFLNHFPIIGTYFSTALLIAGLLLKNQTLIKTSLYLFIATMLFAIPTLKTGDGAAEILDSIGQKNDFFLREHKQLAQNAFWLSVFTGLFSIAALINFFRLKRFRIIIIGVLISGIGGSILMTLTGNTGGEIRHTEIRRLVD